MAGVLRGVRGRSAPEDQSPVFPEVVDMEELERRLREARDREHPQASPSGSEPSASVPSSSGPDATPSPVEWRPVGPVVQAPSASDGRRSGTPRPATRTMQRASERASTATLQRVTERAATATMQRVTERAATATMQRATERASLTGRARLQLSRVQDVDDDWGDDAEWEALNDSERIVARRAAREGTSPGRADSDGRLPAAVQAYLDQGNPWQAAFVVKEVLGPPRALSPYRTWPRV